MRLPWRSRAGFTLLELVISVAIIAGIGTVIAQTFFVTTRSNTKVELQKEVKESGDYAIDIMGRIVRTAATITTACADTGATTSSLTLTNPDGGTTTFACEVNAGVARIASISATRTDYLTSSSVTLGADCNTSTLSFVCASIAGTPNNVKINFTLSQKGVSPDQIEQASLPFQTSVSLRR